MSAALRVFTGSSTQQVGRIFATSFDNPLGRELPMPGQACLKVYTSAYLPHTYIHHGLQQKGIEPSGKMKRASPYSARIRGVIS